MSKTMVTNHTQSAGSEADGNDGLAEIELQKLQRQYRIMEGDRKAYSEESRILISKQRLTIEKLQRDGQNLMDELRLLEQRNEDRKKNGIQSKKAELMAEQAETYQRKIKVIMAEVSSLDTQIGLMDRDVEQERAALGGVNAAMHNGDAIGKQIKVLENRLDKALVKFNKSLAINKKLRSTIDNLRRERLVFDNIYRKFERELMEQKKQMSDIIEASNSAYEARDEAQTRIIALREKAEKEYQSYMQEIKELDRALEQDRKLKEFMAAKISDRQEKVDQNDMYGNSKNKRGDKDPNKLQSQEVITESVETYEKAFEDIRKVTGCGDIGVLVQQFKEIEDRNFSLFNYVNEINNEIEILQEEIVNYQKAIDGIRISNINAEEERKKIMKSLEDQLEEHNKQSSEYESKQSEVSFRLSDLRKGIDRLVHKFQSTKLPRVRPNTRNGRNGTPATGALPTGTLSTDSIENPTDDESKEVNSGGDENGGTDKFQSQGSEKSLRTSNSHIKSALKLDTSITDPEEEEMAAESEKSKITYVMGPDVLGAGNDSTTDEILLQVLGMVEQKANELLTLNYIFNVPKKTIGSAAAGGSGEEKSEPAKEAIILPLGSIGGLLGVGPLAAVGNMSIAAPSTGDDHDSEELSDEDERPLTRDELKAKTMKGISKREKASGGATSGVHKADGGKPRRKTRNPKVERD